MVINSFLEALAITGINTGTAILALFDFGSGDNLLTFNQIYSTGYNYYNNFPFDGATPLIFNGSGHQPSGNFNSNDFYQISYKFSNDFTSILYLNHSGCVYSGNSNLMLVSTVQNPSINTGVYLGITPSNRLFVQTSDYSYTLPREIGVNDFVYLNVSQNRFVNFGLWSMEDNILYSNYYDEGSSILNVSELCFGGTLNYPTYFTGYSGKMNEIYLFSGSLNSNSIINCINCAFVTGYSIIPTTLTYTGISITGSYWSGISSIQITGYTYVLESYPELTGGTGYVYINSGLSGTVSSYKALIPQTQNVLYSGIVNSFSFLYNTAEMLNGMLFNIYFDQQLCSGDIVEIHTYPLFNQNISLPIYNFEYPISNQIIQLYGNGLAETIDIDYRVAFNNLILGFDNSDNLQYDIYPETYTFSYTTPPILTGISNNNEITITGISGYNNFLSGNIYDIYLNGQKMTSGVNYSYSGQILSVSGNDLLDINDSNQDYLEIKFIPQYSNTIQEIIQITGNQSIITGISGFNSQIWVNGIRQLINNDYFQNAVCVFCTGFYDYPNYKFNLYNSLNDEIGLFEFNLLEGIEDLEGNVILDINGNPILPI